MTKVTELRLFRKLFTDKSTIGDLFLDGKFICHTLEDKTRRLKVFGETAIWSGRYEVILSFSNRFQVFLPLILNVPEYKGIRIHKGNAPSDTQGCPLVGDKIARDLIYESRNAFNRLMPLLEKCAKKSKIFITIEGGYSYPDWKKNDPRGEAQWA